jgi:hypothetical protein
MDQKNFGALLMELSHCTFLRSRHDRTKRQILIVALPILLSMNLDFFNSIYQQSSFGPFRLKSNEQNGIAMVTDAPLKMMKFPSGRPFRWTK